MTYIYTEKNRLEQPHNYMYTAFEGNSFIRSYLSDRYAVLGTIAAVNYKNEMLGQQVAADLMEYLESSFERVSLEASSKFRSLLLYKNIMQFDAQAGSNKDDRNLSVEPLREFTDLKTITTVDLLRALINAQLKEGHSSSIKKWVDRLIQRFEVTKKIYKIYPKGFRKGEGGNKIVHLYWLFALSLSLYYTQTHKIKYLSTLLKVCDLLCSLPRAMLCDNVSSNTMAAILATEIVSVQLLAEDRGV